MGCHQKKKKKSFAAATLIKLSISGEEALRLGIKLDYGLQEPKKDKELQKRLFLRLMMVKHFLEQSHMRSWELWDSEPLMLMATPMMSKFKNKKKESGPKMECGLLEIEMVKEQLA